MTALTAVFTDFRLFNAQYTRIVPDTTRWLQSQCKGQHDNSLVNGMYPPTCLVVEVPQDTHVQLLAVSFLQKQQVQRHLPRASQDCVKQLTTNRRQRGPEILREHACMRCKLMLNNNLCFHHVVCWSHLAWADAVLLTERNHVGAGCIAQIPSSCATYSQGSSKAVSHT